MKTAKTTKTTGNRPTIAEGNAAAAAKIAQPFIDALSEGVVPWKRPWTGLGSPVSIDGREYRGFNALLLDYLCYKHGWQTPVFLTLPRVNDIGGKVRRGEHGACVSFWKVYAPNGAPVPADASGDASGEEEGEETAAPASDARKARPKYVLRYYYVFNVAQCDFEDGALEKHLPRDARTRPACTFPEDVSAAGEGVWNGYADGPARLPESGARAFYRPSTDEIQMPPRANFDSAQDYYATLFHEMVHSTGHVSRLNRIRQTAAFGEEDYGREELVAEIGSAMLCGRCGFAPATLDNSKAYVAGWLRAIKGNPGMLVSAASAAQKAVDRIVGAAG